MRKGERGEKSRHIRSSQVRLQEKVQAPDKNAVEGGRGREGHLAKKYITMYAPRRLCPMPISIGIAAVPKEKFELLKWMFGVPARRVQGPALACDLLMPTAASASATRIFCVSLRGGGRNEMNLLPTALKHAQLPLHSVPLPVLQPSSSHPTPPTISPAGHGPALWPLTQGRPITHTHTHSHSQRQPNPTQPALLAISFFYDGCYPFCLCTTQPLQFSYAVFIT